MQTEALLCDYLNKDVAKLVIEYLKSNVKHCHNSAKFVDYYLALNGFYEECLNITSSFGLTGAINGQHEHIVKLISNKMHVIDRHINRACSFKNLNIVKLLLKKRVHLDACECISNACHTGSVEILEYLLDKFKPNKMDDYLEMCYKYRNIDKINICLSQDAKQYSNYTQSVQNGLQIASCRGDLKLMVLIHEYARKNHCILNWRSVSVCAKNANVLQYMFEQDTFNYDVLFNIHAYPPYNVSHTSTKIRATDLILKVKLILPHVRLNTLNKCIKYLSARIKVHPSLYDNIIIKRDIYDNIIIKRDILPLVKSELILRAIKL